jgi:hypothetical protein
LVLLLLFICIGKPFSKKDTVDSGSSENKADTVAQNEYTEFEHNAYPEVNAFVESYFQALSSCDINLLGTMVKDPAQFDINQLSRLQEYIVNYSNVQCYTKPGMAEGEYVVYAVVNTQITNVSVQPLSLYQFYLVPNENGGYIHDNTSGTNAELTDYLNQVNQDPDVQELFERVESNNEDSAKTDDALRQFYESMNAPIETGEDETPVENETVEDETPVENETVENETPVEE